LREAAARCPLPYATTVVREERGGEKVYHLEYGFCWFQTQLTNISGGIWLARQAATEFLP